MINISITKPSKNYELIDSGDGEKLERFGQYILRRPDPQVLWKKNLSEKEWKKADASFVREGNNTKWKIKEGLPHEWVIEMSGLKFFIKPTAFKHTGLFPEQETNWRWVMEKIKNSGRSIKILNLFGYTGGATLAGLSAGAKMTQVDSSKSALTWAKQNVEVSKLDDKSVRWIEDDVRKFVEREIKRGNKYDAIVMDPPAFGHGAKNELWKIEEDFIKLLDLCEKVLSEKPLFVLVNGYSSGYSSIAYRNSLEPLMKKFGGQIENGELVIEESSTGRLLPAGIFSRWFI